MLHRNVESDAVENDINHIRPKRNITYLTQLPDNSEIYRICAEVIAISYCASFKSLLIHGVSSKSIEYMRSFNDPPKLLIVQTLLRQLIIA